MTGMSSQPNRGGARPSDQALAVPATPASAVDGPAGFDPSRMTSDSLHEVWFCDEGGFWGTSKQLLLCARCGKVEHKRCDEKRHYAQPLTPFIHMVCDECFDALPENGMRRYAIATEARRAGTENTGPVHEGADPKGIAQ